MLYNITMTTAQRSAVSHYLGPALVIAGPGSGKTFVITHRIQSLIEQYHIDPSNILVITFTRAAATSMQQRFYDLCSSEFSPVTFKTFHSLFFSILSEHYHYQAQSILKQSEKIYYVREALSRASFPKLRTLDPEELLQLVSFSKNNQKLPTSALEEYEIEFQEFLLFYKILQEIVKKEHRLDFDDMLLQCYQLFKIEPKILKKWQEHYSFILVDEFQDTSTLQYRVLKMLAGKEENLFVVGDDDQSIYGFRGADTLVMQQFLVDYPQAVRIPLDINYRCERSIVEISERIIEKNKNRLPKKISAKKEEEGEIKIESFEDILQEYQYIVTRIQEMTNNTNIKYEEMAVLMRTNLNMNLMASLLGQRNIPVTIYGKAAVSHGNYIGKDFLSYLKAALDPCNIGELFRIINKPSRYISRSAFGIITNKSAVLPQLIAYYGEDRDRKRLLNILEKHLKKLLKMPPFLAIRYIRTSLGYEEYLKKKDTSTEKMEEIDAYLNYIQKMAGEYDSLEEFIAALEEDPVLKEDMNGANVENGVNLMTIHASKGLEFQYVCVPDLNEGKLPNVRAISEAEIEEERRMFYVAVTRAKKVLDLIWVKGTKEHPRLPSRFIYGLTISSNS